MRREIVVIMEARTGVKIKDPSIKPGAHNSYDPNAMDVDSLAKRGKGASKGGKFHGNCDTCGKYGHKKADCWSTKPDPKGGKKGDGKTGKAMGKQEEPQRSLTATVTTVGSTATGKQTAGVRRRGLGARKEARRAAPKARTPWTRRRPEKSTTHSTLGLCGAQRMSRQSSHR